MKIICLILLLLVGCTASQEQVWKDLGREFIKASSYDSQGYDYNCAKMVEALIKTNQVTPEQGNLMMYEKCQKAVQPTKPATGSPFGCPFCGGMGMEITRVRATGMTVYPCICTYRCFHGHTWQRECL